MSFSGFLMSRALVAMPIQTARFSLVATKSTASVPHFVEIRGQGCSIAGWAPMHL